jgi:glutaminase
VASYSHGEHYTGVYLLDGGTLLAISPTSPRLVFFSPSLEPAGTADTDLHVAAVI